MHYTILLHVASSISKEELQKENRTAKWHSWSKIYSICKTVMQSVNKYFVSLPTQDARHFHPVEVGFAM